MSFFKRVSATLTANIDRAICQIENHDAVVEVAVDEVRDASARLKVQLARIKTEIRRLETQAKTLGADEQRWTRRARRVATEDEDRAMTCLKRRQNCREQLAKVGDQLGKSRELERRLEADLERLRQRLEEIHHRRQELRGRELSAKGCNVAANFNHNKALDIERLFERWEVDVTRNEIGSEWHEHADFAPGDSLADEFEKAEHKAELRAELEQLMNEKETGR